jgi:cytochrome c-type biogenesis protein CcmH
MRFIQFLGLVMLLALPVPQAAFAVLPDEVLSDPALEARARELSKGLRCLVCRNQSIDDSNAELARDLRLLLRERLVAGDDDAEALQYLVDRYGIYILLKPPFKATTVLLWLGPALLLMVALLGFSALWWRRPEKPTAPPEMSEDDRAVLAAVLQNKELK